MAEIVNMPRLSDTMEEGVVAKWLKEKGDKVKEGDILAEIETDKATMEFESFYEGTLLHIGVEEGDGAPVDSLLAIIGEEGEDVEGLIKKQTLNLQVMRILKMRILIKKTLKKVIQVKIINLMTIKSLMMTIYLKVLRLLPCHV